MLVALDQVTSLGPARVVQAVGNQVQLEVSDRRLWALMALTFPYQPAEGDLVLLIGQHETWYVIGVLQGRGKTTIMAPADLVIRAPRGTIELIAAKGLRIRSPEVRIVADRLEFVARMVSETFGRARRWIKEAFDVRAGRIQTTVDSTYRLKAERIVERAEKDVKIDGRKIHLG